MPVYKVSDPVTGLTLKLTGDSPPTEEELTHIFDTMSTPKQTPSDDGDWIDVEIEGKGVVAQFPKGTDPAVIDMAIQRDFFPNKQRGMTPQPQQPESIPRMVAGKVAPYLPVAGMAAGAVLAAPVNLVAPGVAEAAGAGLGYLAGK
jgi:hypothetical protein